MRLDAQREERILARPLTGGPRRQPENALPKILNKYAAETLSAKRIAANEIIMDTAINSDEEQKIGMKSQAVIYQNIPLHKQEPEMLDSNRTSAQDS